MNRWLPLVEHFPISRLATYCLIGLAGTAHATDPAKFCPWRAPLELLFLGEKPARLELHVEIDRTPVPAVWDETFSKILSYFDRDGDGCLNKIESARLPSVFAVRQVLWGRIAPYSGEVPLFEDLDTTGDGKVNGEELERYFRRGGLGGPIVAVGKSLVSSQLTDALLSQLDSNKDGKVDEAEWKAASVSLFKLDKNDDELIGPGELVGNTVYPGATASILCSAPSVNSQSDPTTDALPFVVLPSQFADHHWVNDIARRRDKMDWVVMTPNALVESRNDPPAAKWNCNLGIRMNLTPSLNPVGGKPLTNGRLLFATKSILVKIRADQGRLKGQMAAARKHFTAVFVDCDSNSDGILDQEEIAKPKARLLRPIASISDKNGDENLSGKELKEWLDLQEQIAKGHAMVSVLDHGKGLFELLDEDNNGSLSVRELRGAWDRLKKAECVTVNGFEQSQLPHQLRTVISHGHPFTTLGKPDRVGPSWFLAMDRNEDGDISIREWVGDPKIFRRLDQDRDGLLSAGEAEKAPSGNPG